MKNILLILCFALLASCGTESNNSSQQTIAVDAKALSETIKYSEDDPFIETIKKSEFFKVSGLEDKVIETNNGTIISIPKGAFIDQQGNIVEKEITIEIKDIDSFEEQFNANINSAAGQEVLLNGGALYINATADNNTLRLNEGAPIYIETIQKSDQDLLVFQGIRNDKGEMNWVNPKQPKKYLIQVDLEGLDFLPEGFSNEVDKNMPFGNYKTSSKELIDSLYYSLTPIDGSFFSNEIGVADISDDYENFYSLVDSDTVFTENLPDTIARASCNAIKPASIKVVKGDKFSKSFISTKQFEERLQTIHKTRNQKVLEVYTRNLSQNLSYCDSLASSIYAKGSPFQLTFNSYAKEGWSNLKNLPRSVRNLGSYYSGNLIKVEKELRDAKIKYEMALEKKSIAAKKIEENFKRVLTKRQNYRLNRNGYTLTKLGWTGRGLIIDTMKIQLKVENGSDYDRVHVYTIDPSIKSLFAWQSANKINFEYGFSQDTWLIYKNGLQAKALVVAYKNGNPYYDIQNFTTTNVIDIKFSLQPTTKSELSRLINQLDRGSRNFNKVKVDVEYQANFYKEKQRLKKVISDQKVIAQLTEFVFECAVARNE